MADFTFQLQQGALADVKAFGAGSPPEAGFYMVLLTRLEATDKPHSGKIINTIPAVTEIEHNGAKVAINQPAHDGEIWSWWNLKVPNPSGDPEIEKQNKNAEKGQRTTLESIGYAAADINAGAPNQAWLVGRYAFMSYVPPQMGVQGSNPQVDYITKERFLAMKAAGTKPERRAAASGGNVAGVQPQGYAPPPPPPGGQGFAPPPPPPSSGGGGSPPAPPPTQSAPPAPPVAAGQSFPPPPPPPR